MILYNVCERERNIWLLKQEMWLMLERQRVTFLHNICGIDSDSQCSNSNHEAWHVAMHN